MDFLRVKSLKKCTATAGRPRFFWASWKSLNVTRVNLQKHSGPSHHRFAPNYRHRWPRLHLRCRVSFHQDWRYVYIPFYSFTNKKNLFLNSWVSYRDVDTILKNILIPSPNFEASLCIISNVQFAASMST